MTAADMTFEEYLAIDAVNWSSLKPLEKSPLAYRYAKDHPRTESTATQTEGHLLHAMVLEPGEVASRYVRSDRLPEPDMSDVVVYGGIRRKGIKEWEDFQARHFGITILIASEVEPERSRRALASIEALGLTVIPPRIWDECEAMSQAVRAHPAAAALLDGAMTEQVITWADPDTGLRCKARLDIIGHGFIADLKTSRDITPHAWWSSVAKFGYHCQMAHYAAGARAITEQSMDCYIIAVEKVAPYDVGVFRMSSMDLASGQRKVSSLMARLKTCLDSNEWPGIYPGAEPYLSDVPNWDGSDEDGDSFDGITVGTKEME